MNDLNIINLQLSQIVTAIGGLGIAAFGLVDASKSIFGFIDRIGLKHIKATVESLTPDQTGPGLPRDPVNTLPRNKILDTIAANWVNGKDLDSQKAIAKSLVKLYLTDGNAEAVAAKTNVDPALLKAATAKTLACAPLLQPESDVLSRFDFILTAILDEAYERSDQGYRNGTRTLAASVAVLLAVAGALGLEGLQLLHAPRDAGLAILVGLLATPLAPIAKDLSSAIANAVSTMQLVNK